MIRVWIKIPTGREIELSDSEVSDLVGSDWMDKDIGEIANVVNRSLGLPVKVEEISTYLIGYPL